MRSKFDQQLALLNEELTQMGETCAKAIGLAAQALEEQDAAAAAPVAELEEQTNEQERSIESLCLKLLLQQQPVARDLRQISAALKMITDMERIGDQAADIAEIIPFFLSHNTFDCTLVCRMAQQASSMVTQSVDAFVRRDVDLARSITKQDDLVDEDFSNVKQALISAIAREPGQGEVALDLLMIAKYFERTRSTCPNGSNSPSPACTSTTAWNTNDPLSQKAAGPFSGLAAFCCVYYNQ